VQGSVYPKITDRRAISAPVALAPTETGDEGGEKGKGMTLTVQGKRDDEAKHVGKTCEKHSANGCSADGYSVDPGKRAVSEEEAGGEKPRSIEGGLGEKRDVEEGEEAPCAIWGTCPGEEEVGPRSLEGGSPEKRTIDEGEKAPCNIFGTCPGKEEEPRSTEDGSSEKRTDEEKALESMNPDIMRRGNPKVWPFPWYDSECKPEDYGVKGCGHDQENVLQCVQNAKGTWKWSVVQHCDRDNNNYCMDDGSGPRCTYIVFSPGQKRGAAGQHQEEDDEVAVVVVSNHLAIEGRVREKKRAASAGPWPGDTCGKDEENDLSCGHDDENVLQCVSVSNGTWRWLIAKACAPLGAKCSGNFHDDEGYGCQWLLPGGRRRRGTRSTRSVDDAEFLGPNHAAVESGLGVEERDEGKGTPNPFPGYTCNEATAANTAICGRNQWNVLKCLADPKGVWRWTVSQTCHKQGTVCFDYGKGPFCMHPSPPVWGADSGPPGFVRRGLLLDGRALGAGEEVEEEEEGTGKGGRSEEKREGSNAEPYSPSPGDGCGTKDHNKLNCGVQQVNLLQCLPNPKGGVWEWTVMENCMKAIPLGMCFTEGNAPMCLAKRDVIARRRAEVEGGGLGVGVERREGVGSVRRSEGDRCKTSGATGCSHRKT
jgi:hypothetical protein